MANANVPRTPAPISSPISDTDRTGKMTGFIPLMWSDYFNSIDMQLQGSYLVLSAQRIPVGSTAVGTTPLTESTLPAGLYRVAYYLVELQADNTASSVQITIGWTDRGAVRFLTSPALTTNNVSAAASGTLMLRCDRATAITYAVAYSSTGGAPKMIYSLDIVVEQVVALP